jgi:hypothetical protein
MRARQQKPKDPYRLEQLLSGGGRIDTRRRGERLGNPAAHRSARQESRVAAGKSDHGVHDEAREMIGAATALIALAVLSLTAGPGSAQAATPAPLVPFSRLAPFGQLYIYPKDGASYSQQATDYYECDIWAVKQTDFDPTLENGGVPPDLAPARQVQYLRAEATCLETRGYAVKIVRAAS